MASKTFEASSDSDNDQHVSVSMSRSSERPQTRESIGNVSTYEVDLLNRTLRDAAEWAYGIVAVDMWAFREEDGMLFRPLEARHVDQAWKASAHDVNVHENDYLNCAYCRLGDPKHPRFVNRPMEVAPGIELPGIFWSELSRPGRTQRTSVVMEDVADNPTHMKTIRWRNIQSIADDPDQPYSELIQLTVEVGIGWGAGVPFNVNGVRGLVMYYSRKSVDLRQLQSTYNEDYLMAAADFIGSAWALRVPRLVAVREREDRLKKTMRRLRAKLKALLAFGATLQDIRDKRVSGSDLPGTGSSQGLIPHSFQDAGKLLMDGGKKAAKVTKEEVTKKAAWSERKLRQLARKSKGSRVMGPPPFTWEQTLVTGFGVLCTIAVILNLNYHLVDWYGTEYSMALGPLASFTASLYMLTAAPATQPRNNLLAQTCAMVVGLCIAYATPIHTWVREVISVTVCIMLQVKLGFIHAPAAGIALTFAAGTQSWNQIPIQICANMIAIVMATIINNLNDKRQYPTAWGFQPLFRYIDDRRYKMQKKKKQAEDNE